MFFLHVFERKKKITKRIGKKRRKNLSRERKIYERKYMKRKGKKRKKERTKVKKADIERNNKSTRRVKD